MKAARPASPAEATIGIDNRLPAGHRWRAVVDGVFRAALQDLPGPWNVSVLPVDGLWFRINVVAPDGASWSVSAVVEDGPRIEDLADTIRAACVRHCRVRPANAPRRRRAPGLAAAPAVRKGTSK